MRWLMVVGLGLAFASGSAKADMTADLLCQLHQAQLRQASQAGDVARLRSLLTEIPRTCPLHAEAQRDLKAALGHGHPIVHPPPSASRSKAAQAPAQRTPPPIEPTEANFKRAFRAFGAAAPPALPDARGLPAASAAPVLAPGQRPGNFAAFRDCADCLQMVALPGGTFTMGSPKDEPGRSGDEDQVSVTLPGFAISRFPVTRGQYAAFVAATGRATVGGCYTDRAKKGDWAPDPKGTWRDPAFSQDESHPVVCVDWSDAVAFAAWMKTKTGGEEYRLLSEAEYEYANRAGTKTAYFWGADANAGCAYANMADATAKKAFPTWTTVTCDDGYERTSPVGHYAANPWGLFDTTGNVWSWTADCHANSHVANPKTGAPASSADCSSRVVRGGSWGSSPQFLRSADRDRDDPANRDSDLGFRLARTLSPLLPDPITFPRP